MGQGDDTCIGHYSDFVIVSVRDVHIARYVHRHPLGIIQQSRSCRSTITITSNIPRACNGGDDTCTGHESDLGIAIVRDVHIARYTNRYPIGFIELCRSSRTTITTTSLCTSACKGGDDALDIRNKS